jgi:Protein of unknown function (DUF4229)
MPPSSGAKPTCLTSPVKVPPVVTYSLARIAIFAVTLFFLLLALPQLNLLVVAAIAALVSGALSYYLLAGPREQLARSVASQVRRVQERLDRGAAAEDAALDAAEKSSAHPPADTSADTPVDTSADASAGKASADEPRRPPSPSPGPSE